MEIDLKEQIVILDEAHNMEDSSRDAASGSLTTEQINQAIYNLQELCELLPLIWAMTCDFQQCGILTSVVSDEPVQPPFMRRNSK